MVPAGGAVGSLVEGAPAVAVLEGAGTAGAVSVAAGASVLVVFFFLEKKDLSLSRGESARVDYASASCRMACDKGSRGVPLSLPPMLNELYLER